MKTDYDVIIVGAGPAGASCAKHLVDNGVKTLVIEKKKLPGYKCCAGLLSNNTVEIIRKKSGKIPENIFCSNRKIRVKISKRGYNFFEDSTEWYNINRAYFNLWLVENSKCEIKNALYINHKVINDKIEVKLNQNNKIIKVTCNYFVGADGSGSKVRLNIDNNYKLSNLFFCKNVICECEINDKEELANYCHFILSKKYSDRWAGILFKDDLLYYGNCYRVQNKNNNYLNDFVNFLKSSYNLKIKKIIRNEACFLAPYDNPDLFFGKNNILLTGEAAGLIDKNDEGIPFAMISGEILADAIINNENILNEYSMNIKNKLKREY